MTYKKVVIIGGGFGGIQVAKNLKMAYLDLVLIDKSNHHLFQPLLYQVATATLSPAEIAYPIREIFRGQANVRVMMGEVAAIQKEQKRLIFHNQDTCSYDYLVIACGATHSYFGNDAWALRAPGIKTLRDALHIREKILLSFEIAERLEHPHEQAPYLTFVIIGGGPTGVELAGSIAEICHTVMKGNYRHIRTERSRIYLIEALPRILPTYSQKLAAKAARDLEHLGVHIYTGHKVTEITEHGIFMGTHFIASHNIVWAAGNQASPLLNTLQVPRDAQGRILVLPDLTIPGHPEVFVIGDASHTKDDDGTPLPSTAAVAVQQGRYVARILNHLNSSKPRKPFCYRDRGQIATIGKGKAIANVRGFEFGGLCAWLCWSVLHVLYLIGFRNRLRVMLEWTLAFASGKRGVRIIMGKADTHVSSKK